MKNFISGLIALIFFTTLTVTMVFSGNEIVKKTLDRPYEVHQNSITSHYDAFKGQPIPELHLYVYNRDDNKWSPLAFQIDEMDNVDNPDDLDYFANHNAKLDSVDEIVFLIRDIGDKAPEDSWISDVESRKYPRYEIEIYDSTDISYDENKQKIRNKVGWVYLYRSSTITEKSPVSYLTYQEANDRIISTYYEAGYNDKGVLDHFLITQQGGGSNTDILDRQKYWVEGIYPPNLGYSLTEDKFVISNVKMIKGPVRMLHQFTCSFELMPGSYVFENEKLTAKFFPYYLQYSSSAIAFLEQYGVEKVRQTWDFNADASGMKFFNMNNTNIPIDGTPDAVEDTLEHNEINWMMVTGNQGTVLAVNDVGFIGASQRLYWVDENKTHADDTGDKKSFGEMGIQVTGYRIADTLTYKSNIFFLPANQSTNIVDKVINDFTVPVYEGWREQEYKEPTSVANSRESQPTDFLLEQNFPNPFNPETTIQFSVPYETEVKIVVMNILGQQIKTLTNQKYVPGRHKIVWHGMDNAGHKVSSGVYFYQLTSDNFRELRKMILIE